MTEAWGSGLQRIKKAAKEYDLPKPEFIKMLETFRVNLYRYVFQAQIDIHTPADNHNIIGMSENDGKNVGDIGEKSENDDKNVGDVKESVLRIISDNKKGKWSEINSCKY